MSAPTSSFEMDSLDEKTIPLILTDSLLMKDSEDANEIKETSLSNLKSYIWSSSDEDSALTVGIKYTTEISSIQKIINDIILSLKNAPTGGKVEVDCLKETGLDTNVFATIFTTKPTIDINKFSSVSAAIPAVISDSTWEIDRRMQIQITLVDTNDAATGLKVEFR